MVAAKSWWRLSVGIYEDKRRNIVADFTSIHAAGSSIARYLSYCFAQRQPIDGKTTSVMMARTEDIENANTADAIISEPALSLYLYRIDFNKVMRAAWSSVGFFDGESHLPLDLHFLFTAWASNAENEYRILGRTLQCIENNPILTGPMLDPITDWSTQESIQLCLEELSNEEVMRIFDSLPVDYKLSIPYVARVLVLDGKEEYQDQPATMITTGSVSGVAE
ncbi:MAG: DUF4255 domain-containing protein [Gammaproteobacteria bacterium]|nr:DUF4255 domain-containing protein [Gammaproteobacteria bacterium]